MVLFLAGVGSFITWLTLTYSQVEAIERLGGTLFAFVAIGGTLTHYVLSCMRRHCRHGRNPGAEQRQGAAR